MFFYYFFNLITAPGVIVHELSHALFCVLAKVKIVRIKLFGFGNPAGYVTHAEPTKFYQSFLISFGPLIVNSLLSMFLFSQFKHPYYHWQSILFLWLGVAIGLHAIPSAKDAKSLLQSANYRFWRNPLVIVAYPFILVLYILNLLKRLHIDIVYVAFLFWLGNLYLKHL